MVDVQIYYTFIDYLDHYKQVLQNMNIDLDITLSQGDKSVQEIYESVNSDTSFCRDENSISKKHLVSLIQSDIILYADIDDKVAGGVCFAFSEKEGEIGIHLNGICSPSRYAKQRVGENLIKSLITMSKVNDVKYIDLNCKGSIMKYYRDKYGFKVMDTEPASNSENTFYFMKLDLSKTGGYIKRKHKQPYKKVYKKSKRNDIRKRRKCTRKLKK